MPTYFARKAGNINAADVWATTPTGTASNLFPTFTSADVLMSNSFAITVNVSTTVAEVRNDTTGGATNGGSFSLSAGVTLAADLYNAAGGVTLLTCAISAPSSAAIVSNVIRNASSSGNAFTVSNTGSGTLNISVSNNITGGAGGSGVNRAAGVNAAGGVVNITGNVTGGTHASSPGAQANGGMLNITGIVTGNVGPGAANMLSGTTTIIGPARGGASAVGAINESTGMLVATRAVGNGYGPGNVAGLAATVGISNAGLGVVEIQELEYGTFGQTPTSGTGIRLKKAGSNVAVFNYCDTAGAKTLIDATANASMPAATDVRNGVSYASGALSGSCAVPAAGSVALGVAVDASFGTAVLTPAAIRAELATELARIDTTISSRLSPSGTLATVTTLTNAPTSVTPSDIWSHATRTITGGTVDTLTNAPTVPSAASIRAEIDSNSTQLAAIKAKTDLLPASPAATGDIPTAAQNATAVWSKPANELTVADSIGERAKQQSTVSITGAQLAAALS